VPADVSVPLHSFKYAAALQHSAGETNKAPLLLRHHLKAGHGAGKPTKKVIEEAAERFAFLMRATETAFIPIAQISGRSRI
jgi:prolyl oligopeptidase